MTYATEWSTIAARFNTQWADATPIAWPNVDFEPPADGSAWVRITHLPGEATQPEIGTDPLYRHPGVVVVQVFAPVDNGPEAAFTLADSVCAIWRGWKPAGFFVRAPWVRVVGDTGDGWFQLNVTVAFVRDSTF